MTASPAAALRGAAMTAFQNTGGVGVDLVDVAMLQLLVDLGGDHFIDAYWTASEQMWAENKIERLAGRWAAKEAVMKSLGTGVGRVDPIDIEVSTIATGAPLVTLHHEAAEVARTLDVDVCHVTITHEAGWAAAIAVAVKRSVEAEPLSRPSWDGQRKPNG